MPLFKKTSPPFAGESNAIQTPDSSPSLLRRLSRRSSSQTPIETAQTESPKERRSSSQSPTPRPSSQRPQQSASSGTSPRAEAAGTIPDVAEAGDGLSKDDVKNLFYGAPHFMLEKGKHGAAFPQAFFPWNKDVEIYDLQDRKYLKHESFTLATLHAHLPIPDRLSWKPSSIGPQKQGEVWKRPMFDLGIFEVPNMLSLDGQVPGTVGLRYFLELPLAETYRTGARTLPEQRRKSASHDLPTFETFKALDHGQGHAAIGKRAPFQDRMQLITDGPVGWKRVGIRNIDTLNVIERLSHISLIHTEVLEEGWRVSVLDKQKCESLYEQLFGTFLYPPEKDKYKEEPHGLKIQIEALVRVLTTPGVWIDFSLVEWRMRLGQVLWEQEGSGDGGVNCPPGGERSWLLIQLLLAIELLIRLDAAIRLGIAHKTEDFHLTGEEIHHFNKLRNTKVNWDLVVARRFLDSVEVGKASTLFSAMDHPPDDINLVSEPRHPDGLRENVRHQPVDSMSTWNCIILPRQAKLQIEALMRFARLIDWPSAEKVEDNLTPALTSTETLEQAYGFPIPSVPQGRNEAQTDFAKGHVTLQPAKSIRPGGWLTRSWLTGLVIPSDTAGGLIMACLLENDKDAVVELGEYAMLRGGFILNKRSWWSKFCVVGRVFASLEGGSECMGWISIPKLRPTGQDGQIFPNGWLDVVVQPVPNRREGWRIHDGVKLAEESSPLGTGHGKVASKEFGMIGEEILDHLEPSTVKLDRVVLEIDGTTSTKQKKCKASATFEVESPRIQGPRSRKLKLVHDVYFVSAYCCRLPHGHVVSAAHDFGNHPRHQHAEFLPAHPLHNTYKYKVVNILDLTEILPPNPCEDSSEVWILEAKDSLIKDVYARAWCSQSGINALIARSGRTCLSCAIREARALQLGLIIRITGESSTS